jgi:hypothetical protein
LEELRRGVASHFWEETRGVASEADAASMGVSSHRLRLMIGLYNEKAS